MPTVYLIPCVIADDAVETIPAYVVEHVKKCQVFFVENERTARRYLKSIWKEMVIDDYKWFTIHKAEEDVKSDFITALKEGKNIGIISESGCPGIADPGQILIQSAQEMGVQVKPLVGPSSILLALMASGLNGQTFKFCGYLPIDKFERNKALKSLEAESAKLRCTQIFIETPYRNNQLLESVLQNCSASTRLCIAADISSANESIVTKSIAQWKKNIPTIGKVPAIFLILA
ncbi:MAG: SAM-dependent methyltransferase [Bacteroidetes bacterium]|nr:MAG: SAM-dependent methyltransferase [Bacteroidota bacterium]